jgi:hypothetical protein
MAPLDHSKKQPPTDIPNLKHQENTNPPASIAKTNIAFRKRYQKSRSKSNYAGYLIVIACVVALISVVLIVLNRDTSVASIADPKRNQHDDLLTESNDRYSGSLDVDRQSTDSEITESVGKAVEFQNVNPLDNHQTKNNRDNTIRWQESSDKLTDEVKPDSDNRPAASVVEDMSRLNELMASARMSIEKKTFDESNRLLQLARNQATSDEVIAKLERLQTLSDYVGEFWKAHDESLADLEGTELTINDEQVFVVTVDSRRIVIRARGKNREYMVKSLPPKLVVAIADRRFDQSAATTKVFKGAYMAVEPAFGKESALTLWREAADVGVEINDLPLVLTDSYE